MLTRLSAHTPWLCLAWDALMCLSAYGIQSDGKEDTCGCRSNSMDKAPRKELSVVWNTGSIKQPNSRLPHPFSLPKAFPKSRLWVDLLRLQVSTKMVSPSLNIRPGMGPVRVGQRMEETTSDPNSGPFWGSSVIGHRSCPLLPSHDLHHNADSS